MTERRADRAARFRAARTTFVAALAVGAAAVAAPPPVDFNREIRPILSDRCAVCHGPDAGTRKAGLRLDTREGATAMDAAGRAAIIPGDASSSELIRRLTSADPDDRMPPASTGKTVSAAEIETIRRWIDEGAEYRGHWAFEPPRRLEPPAVGDVGAVRNDIDRFILARLASEGLSPSAPASREALIRRVTLDLTGLPPTIGEVDAYLADDSPGAYERVVDRLLASTAYGEHEARFWLDAARYGDTHGLHLDNRRSIWRWRDWVINAFNDNMPFDEFTIEQLAGDLLPDPTLAQLTATGFNRNHVTTSEGGAIDEEYFAKYAIDRAETTATIWLGLTAGCAQCHDHKYDPISQREFYELYAFFNNLEGPAMDGNRPDTPPIIVSPRPEEAIELGRLETIASTLRARLDEPMPDVDAAQAEWESERRDRVAARWRDLTPVEMHSRGGATLAVLEDGSILASGENPPTDVYEIVYETDAVDLRVLKVDVLTHESLPHTGPGRADNANLVLSEFEVEVGPIDNPDAAAPVRFVAAVADHDQAARGYVAETTIDGVIEDPKGWAPEGFARRENRRLLYVADEPFGFSGGTRVRVRMHFLSEFPQHAIGRFRISASAEDELHDVMAPSVAGPWHVAGLFPAASFDDAWSTVAGPEVDPGAIDLDARYDGDVRWTEHPEFGDGVVNPLVGENAATYVYRTIDAPTRRVVTWALGSDDGIRVWVNGEMVLDRKVLRAAAPDQDRIDVPLRAGRNHVLMKIVNAGGQYGFAFRPVRDGDRGTFVDVTERLASGVDDDDARRIVRDYFRRTYSDAFADHVREFEAATAAVDAYRAMLPVTLVTRERREDRRVSAVLIRGQYDQPGDPVEPNVPAVFPPLPDGVAADRLALARWLVDPAHPLTARVTVNRIWQQHFGIGIVRTAEDFGSQGEWPSHPDLLDWLALRFIDSGWDVKALHRLIVTSATYRQSAAVTPALLARDPENRLLARGPRFRLDAEVIRDQALAASGLLERAIGGPSVRPYQPPGLWKVVAYPDSDTREFRPDTGAALHRRSLYTFWKRTSPPPYLSTFDAPTRETCTVSRPRTNT
ncbi:MAG: PSD1 domain-containing protein, partial [Phycisphaerales bacterium]|nr:PSD1 domain-containing protein [Phycisphaerales bacterium]